MNYQKIYDDICKRGQVRELTKEIYTEKHHIVPKCLGGGNEKSNLTKLTAREHFLVHYILTRIYPGNSKIWNACFKMCQTSKNQQRFIPNSRLYEFIKIQWSNLNRGANHFAFGKPKTDEHKKAIGDGNRGKIVSDETRQKMSIAQSGKKLPEKRVEQMRGFMKNNNPRSRKCSINDVEFISIAEASRYFNISNKVCRCRMESTKEEWIEWKYIDESKVSEETRQKSRELHLGKKHSEESKSIMGLKGELNPFFGRSHSEESKEKIRETKRQNRFK